jgi:uncharacterized protein (TIGR02118 family)
VVKFMVVIYRRPDLGESEFQAYLRDVHGPMAEAMPDLLHYTQNVVAHDSTRTRPGWDAIVELFWADRTTMEAAWASAEGKAATADLAEFVDLSRTTWSLVDSQQRR